MSGNPVYLTNSTFGFTLAELLIILAILGIIATFAIPKILSAQQSEKYNSLTQEAASTVSAALETARARGTLSTSTRIVDLVQYMNYLKTDSTTTIDDEDGAAYPFGGAGKACIQLHNGAYLAYNSAHAFAGTATTNGIYFWVDPNGSQDGNKSQFFVITYRGRVISAAEIETNYYGTGGGYVGPGNTNATWFHW